MRVLGSHGILRLVASEDAHGFHKVLKSSGMSEGSLPSDLAIPGAEFEELLSFMDSKVQAFVGDCLL